MAKKKTSGKKSDDSKLFAFLATFFSIIGFIIALLVKKEDDYVMFYAKQSLVLFIFAVLVGIVQMAISWIPIFGWIIGFGLQVIVLVLWVLTWIYALSGEKKETPFIGQYAKKIKL